MFLEVVKHLDVLISLLAVLVDIVRFKRVKKPHSFTNKQNGTCQVLLMSVCASLNGRQL